MVLCVVAEAEKAVLHRVGTPPHRHQTWTVIVIVANVEEAEVDLETLDEESPKTDRLHDKDRAVRIDENGTISEKGVLRSLIDRKAKNSSHLKVPKKTIPI